MSIPFKFPSTRYSGSKLRFLGWIWEKVKDIEFNSVLDVFGGTASVSLLFKYYKKSVYYNDLLKFNQIIGKAIIENSSILVDDEDIAFVLSNSNNHQRFITCNFNNIFFIDSENEWLDAVIYNIAHINNEYKRSILLSALFQSCLAKRPFNLFHRANLNLRLSDVQRSFGNKTTWEKPFDILFKKYINEYNNAIFNNNMNNKMIGGYDAVEAPNNIDLVYLDPPYFSLNPRRSTNYMLFYHFLEGIANYDHWKEMINGYHSKIHRIKDSKEIERWILKENIMESFNNMLCNFKYNKIVLSYRSDGYPSIAEIESMLKKYKNNIRLFYKPHKYVLSKREQKEVLFIAT